MRLKTNCVVTVSGLTSLQIDTKQSRVRNRLFQVKLSSGAVENNSEIAREYGISESMVRRWRKDQANLFNGEIKLSAKRKTMGCFMPKYPELDQRILEWFTEQRSQGKFSVEQQKHDQINQLIAERM